MNHRLILLVVLVVSSVLVAGQKQQRRGRGAASAEVDEDEFSEFDDEFESSKPAAASSQSTQSPPAQAKKSAQPKNDDDEFDSVVLEEEKPSVDKLKEPLSDKKQTRNDFGADELDLEEFENFADDDEFETTTPFGRDEEFEGKSSGQKGKSKQQQQQLDGKSMPNLKIADVPLHLMSSGNWTNYVWEICMLVVIAIYMVNFFYGKSKNYSLVNHWFQTHRAVLEKNFAVVGDDGLTVDVPKAEQNETGSLIKDSESNYALWCTGRASCEGMLIQLKLIKRQDLINGLLMQMVKPQCDQIVISVEYASQEDVDSFVFCLSNRKSAQQILADYQDVSTYCVEKKLGTGASIVDAKYTELLSSTVQSKYVMLNEIGEVPNNVLDKTVCAFLNKYPDMVEYLLISDQYVGYKSMSGEDPSSSQQASNGSTSTTAGALDTTGPQSTGIPKSRAILVLCLNVAGRGLGTTPDEMERMQPAIQLAIYLADKTPHLRLSKEGKSRAIRSRRDISEKFMRMTNKQRQEAAMQRKEEKRRAEKEKIMNESDPEKQKKLEEKELKREKKKTLSKMKQIKIKAM